MPYPEEPPDYSRTVDNTRFVLVLQEWMYRYQVPVANYDFWREKVVGEITDKIIHAAQAWEQDGVRHLQMRPEYANPGVFAHEACHISYGLLSDDMRQAFAVAYIMAKGKDKYVKQLYNTKWSQWAGVAGANEYVEMHAEIGRYIGLKMPTGLRRYYPMILEES